MNRQGKGKIEYLNYTWSPISGCLHDCEYCYMKRMAARFPQISMEPKFHPERLYGPLYLQKPSIIGVVYSGDMWGKWVFSNWIRQVLIVCQRASWHRFLFLTKNPSRYGEFKIPLNCWCGTSITGQNQKRIDVLMYSTKGRKFVSLEPYVGGIPVTVPVSINWLIVGGLTGKGARKPPKKDIVTIIDSCHVLEIPLFIKSNAGYPEKLQQYPEGLKL